MGNLRPETRLFAAWVAGVVACGCGATAEPGSGSVAQVRQRVVAPPAPAGRTPVPTSNVVFVSTTGNDTTGDGSLSRPFATIAHAVSVVNAEPEGPTWSVVIRGGVYREGEITVTRGSVRIQRYESEHVQLLGSVAQTGFTGAGPFSKVVTGVATARLEVDCADTFPGNPGVEDFGSRTAFSVTRAGLPLRRVATGTAPAAGQYAYDPATDTLALGDAPDGIEVASRLYALRTKASNVTFSGLDVRGYATCAVNWSKTVGADTFYKGSLLVYKDAAADSMSVVRDCTIANNSGGGLAVANARGVRLWNSAIVNHGWDGVQGGNSDGLIVYGSVISHNNVHRWDTTTDAGMKLTHVKDGAVVDNLFEENVGQGFWCDQGCGATGLTNRFVVARNVFRRNTENGVMYEVSHQALIVSNVAHANGRAGIFLSGARNVQVWNNTAIDNCAATDAYLGNVSVVDDRRCVGGDLLPDGRPCTGTAGTDPVEPDVYDHCEPSSRGDLANTCNAQGIVLMNNLITGSGSARPLLNVEDPNPTAYGAALIVAASDYQAYYRSAPNQPTNLIEWQTTAGSAADGYRNLSAFRNAVEDREVNSVDTTRGAGNPYLLDDSGDRYELDPSSRDVWNNGAHLPDEVLNAVYYPAPTPARPTLRIGAIRWYGSDDAEPTDGGAGMGGSPSAGGGVSDAAAGGASGGGAASGGSAGATTGSGGATSGGRDGGATAGGGSTSEVDGSVAPGGAASDDGGCGCRTARDAPPASSVALCFGAVAALALRRRRDDMASDGGSRAGGASRSWWRRAN